MIALISLHTFFHLRLLLHREREKKKDILSNKEKWPQFTLSHQTKSDYFTGIFHVIKKIK